MNAGAEELLVASRAMLEAAAQGDWEGLEVLVSRREPLLAAWPPAGLDAAALQALCGTLLELDTQTRRLADAGRREAADQLARIAAGRKARGAYGEG